MHRPPPTISAMRSAESRIVEMKILRAISATSNPTGSSGRAPAAPRPMTVPCAFLPTAMRRSSTCATMRRQPRSRAIYDRPLPRPNRPIVTFEMGANGVNRLSSLPTLPAGEGRQALYVLTSGMSAMPPKSHRPLAGFKLGEVIARPPRAPASATHIFHSRRFRHQRVGGPGGPRLDRQGLGGSGSPPPPSRCGQGARSRPGPCDAPDRYDRGAAEKAALEATPPCFRPSRSRDHGAPIVGLCGSIRRAVSDTRKRKLVFQRSGGPRFTLVPIEPIASRSSMPRWSGLTYSVAGNAVTGFELIRSDGSRVVANRTPDRQVSASRPVPRPSSDGARRRRRNRSF